MLWRCAPWLRRPFHLLFVSMLDFGFWILRLDFVGYYCTYWVWSEASADVVSVVVYYCLGFGGDGMRFLGGGHGDEYLIREGVST